MPTTTRRSLTIAAATLLLTSATYPNLGWAQTAYERSMRATDERLDEMRGGFDMYSMLLSIGISSAVFINDELVITTTLNIPGLGANALVKTPVSVTREVGAGAASGVTKPCAGSGVSKPAAPSLPAVLLSNSGVSLVQNGPGNTAILQQNLPSAGTIVQNTLDNQAIRSLTTINAKVFSQSLMQSLNKTALVQDMFRRPGR